MKMRKALKGAVKVASIPSFADYSPSPVLRHGIQHGTTQVLKRIPVKGRTQTRVNRKVARMSKRMMNAPLRKIY
jgi:hypothetical protein